MFIGCFFEKYFDMEIFGEYWIFIGLSFIIKGGWVDKWVIVKDVNVS